MRIFQKKQKTEFVKVNSVSFLQTQVLRQGVKFQIERILTIILILPLVLGQLIIPNKETSAQTFGSSRGVPSRTTQPKNPISSNNQDKIPSLNDPVPNNPNIVSVNASTIVRSEVQQPLTRHEATVALCESPAGRMDRVQDKFGNGNLSVGPSIPGISNISTNGGLSGGSWNPAT
ncbi:MAG: hypothetical protein ACRC2T_10475, partial [Thermoguttaceae bacterium]